MSNLSPWWNLIKGIKFFLPSFFHVCFFSSSHYFFFYANRSDKTQTHKPKQIWFSFSSHVIFLSHLLLSPLFIAGMKWCEDLSASTILHHHRRVVTVHLVSSWVISLSLPLWFRSHLNFVFYKEVLAAEEDDMVVIGIAGGTRRDLWQMWCSLDSRHTVWGWERKKKICEIRWDLKRRLKIRFSFFFWVYIFFF